MSVTAPLGFTAAGLTAGLKPSGTKDLSLVINNGPDTAVAAVYTSNRCKANPVLWSQKASANGQARAVVLNSGGANCYTGDFGYETTALTAQTTAELLTDAGIDTQAEDVLVCSTGLIGVGGQDFRDSIVNNLAPLVAAADNSVESGQAAAEAIMTTDTVAKVATRTGSSGYTIGGMAKGAGMLAPGLATMLVVITTDAKLDQATLDQALRASTSQSFDRLDTDGCMSTNDTVILMSSGAHDADVDADEFTTLLRELCLDLMHQLHVDAEGAHHDIAITTRGAASEARRRRSLPLRGPLGPVQGRDLRGGPELGSSRRSGGNHLGGFRSHPDRRRHQRRPSVHGLRPRRRPRERDVRPHS
jgi:glutamate N-acetyltransferase/amino-acid N-acetyltransferase